MTPPNKLVMSNLIPILLTEGPGLRATCSGPQDGGQPASQIQVSPLPLQPYRLCVTYRIMGLCYPLGSCAENVNIVYFTLFKVVFFFYKT